MKKLLLLLALVGVFAAGCSKLEELFERPVEDAVPETPIEGVETVDLGLSVKWASCNVGATKPEEYGDYFAWCETSPKDEYTEETYKYVKITVTKDDLGEQITKYEWTDPGDISGTQYDAASVNWGGSWRMPTKTEMVELYNNCTWTWTSLNGVNGMEVTGPNGNSIFLPAAGGRDGSSSVYVGSHGGYWSSTPAEEGGDDAYNLIFNSDYREFDTHDRYPGLSVRPVLE